MKVMLDPGAKMPTRAHPSDAGLDLYTPEAVTVPPTEVKLDWYNNRKGTDKVDIGSACIDTGVHVEIPEGYVGFIKSKSGLNVNNGLTAEGVIDSGYTGSIVVKLYNHTHMPYVFQPHQKIAQLVILPIITPALELADKLGDTERGTGGFGSTGV